ncbi:MAG: type II toxin-antitoxin system RelE/ParE family toxin [Verrucomicrobiota bacterium]
MSKLRVFKTKWFHRFSKKESISDEKIDQTIRDILQGKIDGDYRGGLVKQRLARDNQGKSGGYRIIVLFQVKHRMFFVFGFAKSDRENITSMEEEGFRKLASYYFPLSDKELEMLISTDELTEIFYESKKI